MQRLWIVPGLGLLEPPGDQLLARHDLGRLHVGHSTAKSSAAEVAPLPHHLGHVVLARGLAPPRCSACARLPARRS